MINIVDFEDKYLEQLRDIDFLLWLRVQWDATIMRENVFAATDDNGKLLGVCALCCDGTWFYLDKDVNLPKYRMQMELVTAEGCKNDFYVKKELVSAAKKRVSDIKKNHPEKKLCIRCWCEEKEYIRQEEMLRLGFYGHNIIWVMAFDIDNTPIPHVPEREGVTFEPLLHDDASVREYLAANEKGYNGVQDAEGELRFRLGDERTEVFVTRTNGNICSSATIWHISDERAATENIFTVPDFRRRGLAEFTICKVLSCLKGRGYSQASLSCVGDNEKAIALYLKLGYTISGHLLEMHLDI